MNLTNLPQYRLLQQETLKDIRSEGYLLEHRKTHARILVLENDDENKVFNIAFRTTPGDDTGVAHIIEHTVLCGSREFPAKDPFVELVKGSLNTFLNAMTYPDKTMYPVASCNDTDFRNLMHVYLDAVFYPNIYKKKEIFRQEGWHYELESRSDEITINGVVYNEMKGAFSSPEEVLEREILRTLFPDTTYGVDSGGDPEHIPELTYEDYLEFHRTYYHPSNSYIYLYGDADMEERLAFLDREYLSHFDALEVDSAVALQKPFDGCREVYRQYPVSEEDTLEDNTYLSYSAVVGTSLDTELTNAFAVLDYALLSSPGAALKQALLDAGIGKDIMSTCESGILQPYYGIIAKNANARDKERFLQVVRETLERLVREGIDRKALYAGLNIMEFKAREADYGSYPKGLMYGIDALDSWLYDDSAPFAYLRFDVYAKLKEKVESGYFESLIQTYLLDNPHAAMVVVEPERGLAAKKDQAVREKLAALKASLSEEELSEMAENTRALREFQETPTPEEELKKIPLLSREDIGKEAAPFANEKLLVEGEKVVWHDVFAGGIVYLDLLFDISRVDQEDIPYLGILKAVLGMVDTAHYTYQELNNEINANTGGISAGISNYPVLPEGKQIRAFVGLRSSVLADRLPFTLSMAEEILFTSRFDDDRRLYEILAKLKSRLSMELNSAGHQAASLRCQAGFSQSAAFQDAVGGIGFYRLVEELEGQFREKKEELRARLKKLCRELFCREALTVSLTCDEEGLASFRSSFPSFAAALPAAQDPKKDNALPLVRRREGFMSPSQVQYVARCGSFRDAGYPYTGLLRVVRVMMNYDYLWQNLRVLGGAYGCGASFGRTGETGFVSFRDPHLKRTVEVYGGVPDYLEAFEVDEREMTKYIIGTVSDLDTPLTPAMKGRRSMAAWLGGLAFSEVQREREEVLTATPEKLRALAPMLRAVLDQGYLCVVGGEEKIRSERELFDSIEVLV